MAESVMDQYRRVQIGTAGPAQLVMMMYDGIARFLTQAAHCMDKSNGSDAEYWTERSSRVVQELLATLDFEAGGEVARTLGEIYLMTIRETLRAKLRNDSSILTKLAALYSDLRTGWAQVANSKAV
jgi:flagellar protein FliS